MMRVSQLLGVLLLSTLSLAHAQEIDLTVDINMEKLSVSQRDYVSEFKNKLLAYVNEHRWTTVDFRGDKIPVTLSINFLSGTDAGEFSAQAAVVSQRRTYEDGRPTQSSSLMLRVLDPKWSFTFIKGSPLYHDEFQFNDVSSFLDFYIYLVLGLDFDSMELMQGTPYYQKALNVAQRSQSSARSSEWQGSSNQYSRLNFIGEVMNAQYDSFRASLYWYYYEGVDFMKTEKQDAQNAIIKSIELLSDALTRSTSRSYLLSTWLEANASTYCALLEGHPKRAQLMTAMAQADPVRAEQYRKCNF